MTVTVDAIDDCHTMRFVTTHLVHFEDCDPSGIIFFPNYFIMMNRTVEDWLAHIGKPLTSLIFERRMGIPTAQIDTTFVAPSFFGDKLEFRMSPLKLGTSSLSLQHVVCGHDGSVRLRTNQLLVATSLQTHRSIPWPEDIRAAISCFIEKACE